MLRGLLLLVPGGMLLAWANRLIHTGLSGASPTTIALGTIVGGLGVLFTLSGLAVGVRALREL